MLSYARKSGGAQERRRINQFRPFNSSRPSKETIHRSQPKARAQPGKSFSRDTKVRQQPGRIRRRGAGEFRHDLDHAIFRKAVEKEMRHDQIELILWRRPRCEVM